MERIVAFGDIGIDLRLDVDHHPPPGGEAFARRWRVGLGGSAVNTAVWLVRLGFPAGVVGRIGTDEFGRQALAGLDAAGVDRSGVDATDEAPTAINVLMVTPDGERTMVGLPGANRLYRGGTNWTADWLHMSAYALLEDPQRGAALGALDAARRRGVPISIDVPSGVAGVSGPRLAEVLAGCSIVSLGRESLPLVAPDGVPALVAAGVRLLAVTAGRDPLTLWHGGSCLTLTPPVVETVDATGAGDAFVAGLIAAGLWGLDPGPTATLAAALGAAATTAPGSGTGSDPASILSPGRWPEAPESWVEEARRVVEGR